MDLIHTKTNQLFIHYFIPSLFSTVFVAFYVIGDTMLIGKGIGGTGLIALNILLPLYSLYYGFGYLYGVGGSVLVSIKKGNNKEEEANSIFTTTLFLVLLTSIILVLIGFLFCEPVCYLLGASSHTIQLCKDYGLLLMISGPLFILSPTLQCLIRNDHQPRLAMIAATIGSLLNVLLDYIFIFEFHMGMSGAMIATSMSSIVSILISSTHFFNKTNTLKLNLKGINLHYIQKIYQNGFNSFLSEMTQGVVTYIFNLQILSYLSEQHIIIYSVIANTLMVIICFFNAVSNASQPIVSFNKVAFRSDRIKEIMRICLKLSFIIAIISYAFVFLFTKECISFYVDLHTIHVDYAIKVMRIYFLCIFAQSINLYVASFFQSISKVSYSLIISVLRGFVLIVVLILILPQLFGGEVIWGVVTISEVLSLFISISLLIHVYKEDII